MNYKRGLWCLITTVVVFSVYAASNPASTDYIEMKIALLQAEITAMLDNQG